MEYQNHYLTFKGEFSIPSFRDGDNRAESLNVANATAIFLNELFRGSKV
ncbi:MAG: hypothetical protein CM15mP102_03210 [Flavobacteriales bacterium]|nr:MAG: hypothetical protein CM15mP102_03210 [Flavobacteriales bacterium]